MADDSLDKVFDALAALGIKIPGHPSPEEREKWKTLRKSMRETLLPLLEISGVQFTVID